MEDLPNLWASYAWSVLYVLSMGLAIIIVKDKVTRFVIITGLIVYVLLVTFTLTKLVETQGELIKLQDKKIDLLEQPKDYKRPKAIGV